MTSVRKKYNPLKTQQNHAKWQLRNCVLAMSVRDTDGYVVFWDRIFITPNAETTKKLNKFRFFWKFVLVSKSKESNGKERITTEFHQMLAEYTHVNLIPYLNEKHQLLLKKENDRGNELIDAAWVAAPVKDITEDFAVQLLWMLENDR